MSSGRDEITWARRLPKWKLRRLYESDAAGILDEDLLADVGMTLWLRCKSILAVNDAQHGQVHCPRCEQNGKDTFIVRPQVKGDPRDVLLNCTQCGWQLTWGEYYLSFKRHQLNPGGAVKIFADFIRDYPLCTTSQSKLMVIDRLIHEFHYSYAPLPELPTRPVGVNLIEGKLPDVIQFLNELNAGIDANIELHKICTDWKERLGEYKQSGEVIHQYIRQRKHDEE